MTAEPMFTLTQFTIFMIVMLLLSRVIAELIVLYQDKKTHAVRQHQHEQNKTIKYNYNKKIS